MANSAGSIVLFTLSVIFFCISADGIAQNVAHCRTMSDQNREYICPTFAAMAGISEDTVFLAFHDAKLPSLPEGAFAKFTLSTLVFSECEIGQIDPQAFTGLDQLTKMIFVGTNIHVVKASWFKGLSSLSVLGLSQNEIVYIEPDVFPLMPNLQRLLIDGNNLDCLPSQALQPLKNLTYVRIEQNPWLCSCFAELREWMKDRHIVHEMSEMTGERLECMVEHLPLDRASMWPPYKVFRNLSVSGSGYIGMSPARDVLCVGKNISALSLLPDNVQSIKLLNSQISKIPGFAFLRFGNSLTSLYFRNCSIRDIHPNAFAGLSKLKELFVYDNNFSTVRSEWFRDLHSLDNLGLDANGIRQIEPTVFPMLHKLKHLSLGHNRMQCISTNEFDPLTHLKEVILAHNPWNCSCQESFRKWLHEYRVRYVISRGPCIDGQVQESDDIFEQSFERRQIKIKSQIASSTHTSTTLIVKHGNPTQAGTKLFDEISTSETQRSEIAEKEAEYDQNIENANKGQAEQAEQADAKHYADFRNEYRVEILAKYIHLRNQGHELEQVTTHSTEDSTVKISSAGMENSYVSVGGTLWDVWSISSNAASIRFENSAIPSIVDGSFSRFGGTLRRLVFRNCKVKDIDPQAFGGLVNLEELILSQNQIQTVKSAWLENIPNLKKLSLTQNSITKIDDGAFEFLTHIEQLEISYNQLNSLETDRLDHLKNLSTVQIGNNPWSCLCRRKLSEWLVEHKITYDKESFDERIAFDCTKDIQSSFQITDNQETVLVDNEITDAEDKITGRRGMENLRKSQVKDLNSTVPKVYEAVSATPKTKQESADSQCTFQQFNQERESRWACRGGDISVLDQIPSSADRIDIINSHIPFVPANAFMRFSNLTKLLLYNSSIHYVNALAFSNLKNLQWLIFLNNTIQTVESSWFHNLDNLTLLGLVRNSIREIEPDVFKYIPNLKHLSVQENQLECIYTKSLSPLKYLQKVTIQGNPWKWRCQEDLTQFFEARNISYIKSDTHEGKRFVTINLLEN